MKLLNLGQTSRTERERAFEQMAKSDEPKLINLVKELDQEEKLYNDEMENKQRFNPRGMLAGAKIGQGLGKMIGGMF